MKGQSHCRFSLRPTFAALSLCSVLLGCRDLPTDGARPRPNYRSAKRRSWSMWPRCEPASCAACRTRSRSRCRRRRALARRSSYALPRMAVDASDPTQPWRRRSDCALIVPYQRVFTVPSRVACADDLRLESRAASVTFTSVGEAIVRIVGRAAFRDALIAVERRVSVR